MHQRHWGRQCLNKFKSIIHVQCKAKEWFSIMTDMLTNIKFIIIKSNRVVLLQLVYIFQKISIPVPDYNHFPQYTYVIGTVVRLASSGFEKMLKLQLAQG